MKDAMVGSLVAQGAVIGKMPRGRKKAIFGMLEGIWCVLRGMRMYVVVFPNHTVAFGYEMPKLPGGRARHRRIKGSKGRKFVDSGDGAGDGGVAARQSLCRAQWEDLSRSYGRGGAGFGPGQSDKRNQLPPCGWSQKGEDPGTGEPSRRN